MSNPLVSVIIPVYNGAAFLGEALESVAAQSYRPLEVIVVDDGSTDATAEVVADAQRRLDIPITYHYQENQGPAVARNLAIDHAQGALIAFLDADDLWHEDKLARQAAHLIEHAERAGVICHFTYFLEEGTDWPAQLNRAYYDTAPPAYIPSALMVRNSVFAGVGVFDPELRTAEDTDWFLRAREAGIIIGVTPEILLKRRFHQSNLSYTPQNPRQQVFDVLRRSMRRHSNKTGGSANNP